MPGFSHPFVTLPRPEGTGEDKQPNPYDMMLLLPSTYRRGETVSSLDRVLAIPAVLAVPAGEAGPGVAKAVGI